MSSDMSCEAMGRGIGGVQFVQAQCVDKIENHKVWSQNSEDMIK